MRKFLFGLVVLAFCGNAFATMTIESSQTKKRSWLPKYRWIVRKASAVTVHTATANTLAVEPSYGFFNRVLYTYCSKNDSVSYLYYQVADKNVASHFVTVGVDTFADGVTGYNILDVSDKAFLPYFRVIITSAGAGADSTTALVRVFEYDK